MVLTVKSQTDIKWNGYCQELKKGNGELNAEFDLRMKQ